MERVKGHLPLWMVLGVTILVSAMASRAMAAEALSRGAIDQLRAIVDLKKVRTPAQRKIGSGILWDIQTRKQPGLQNRFPGLAAAARAQTSNFRTVDIEAEVSWSLITRIEGLGGHILSSFPEYRAIQASLPLTAVETLAELPEVVSIKAFTEPELNRTISEGYFAHNASSGSQWNGKGVKVGVLSDSVVNVRDLQDSGDLPAAVTVLSNPTGKTGEGSAMMEVVHDMAAGASLYFHTAFNGQASFANNIIDLANKGCRVIVDNVTYLDESPFQDGIVAQAVNTVVNTKGVLYFSAAGNGGSRKYGTSGTWEGNFNPVNNPYLDIFHASVHNFGGGDSTNQIQIPSRAYTLYWADPAGASGIDYDLYIFDAAGQNLMLFSDDIQDGNDNPYEVVDTLGSPIDNTLNMRIVVAKYEATDPDVFFHVSASDGGKLQYRTQGRIRGHAAAAGAMAIAAVNAAGKTSTFLPTDKVEVYSADGPRRVFFNADGTPLTPGNFTATGGKLLYKPDFAAADNVKVATSAFNPFDGTSAAASHAAGIGAILLSAKSGLTAERARNALVQGSLDIEAAGWDANSGSGIPLVDRALAAIGIPAPPPRKDTPFLPAVYLPLILN